MKVASMLLALLTYGVLETISRLSAVDANAFTTDGYCECTGSCGTSLNSDRPWCYLSSSCSWYQGYNNGYKWGYCNGNVKLVTDCTVCSYHSTGTHGSDSGDFCCLDSSNVCAAEYVSTSSGYAYCAYSSPAFSVNAATPAPTTNTAASAPTPRPTSTDGGATNSPTPGSTQSANSGACLNTLYTAACQALQNGYSAASAGLCTINSQCDAVTCSTPDILATYIGKTSIALAYDPCKNTISISINGVSEVWDLDTPITIVAGVSVQAVDKKRDSSCSKYDVVSFSMVFTVPIVGQVGSIPIEFPVGHTSCGLPKWVMYAAIGGGVFVLVVVAAIAHRIYKKKANAKHSAVNAKVTGESKEVPLGKTT